MFTVVALLLFFYFKSWFCSSLFYGFCSHSLSRSLSLLCRTRMHALNRSNSKRNYRQNGFNSVRKRFNFQLERYLSLILKWFYRSDAKRDFWFHCMCCRCCRCRCCFYLLLCFLYVHLLRSLCSTKRSDRSSNINQIQANVRLSNCAAAETYSYISFCFVLFCLKKELWSLFEGVCAYASRQCAHNIFPMRIPFVSWVFVPFAS